MKGEQDRVNGVSASINHDLIARREVQLHVCDGGLHWNLVAIGLVEEGGIKV